MPTALAANTLPLGDTLLLQTAIQLLFDTFFSCLFLTCYFYLLRILTACLPAVFGKQLNKLNLIE
jgi:hypothetical protein